MKGKTDDRKKRYENAKQNLSLDPDILPDNKKLYLQFLEEHEKKLKRINDLRQLDKGTYKTLYIYIQRFKNVEKWFGKPLKNITKDDIQRVYDGLEDGVILTEYGLPFECRTDYYDKIFKSKLFKMIGKDALAREVIQYQRPVDSEVSFITEEDFRDLVQYANTSLKKLLFWLAWDIGENISALLQLTKKDITEQTNPDTKEPEYRINLRKEILKRSRKARSELTNYSETVKLLDQILKDMKDDDLIFNFDYRNAKQIFDRAIEKTTIKCKPGGQRPTWKDLRSGMACDLLMKGWTTDEINARLGHKPSSDEIDKYVTFLAIDRHRPKKKVQEFELGKLKQELDEMKHREKAKQRESERLKEDLENQLQEQKKQMLELMHDQFEKLKKDPRTLKVHRLLQGNKNEQ